MSDCKASNLAPKMGRWCSAHSSSSAARYDNSCVILNKICCSSSKPGVLKITIRRGPSNLSIGFLFVSCEEKGYYRVFSVGQLSFDYRLYCGCKATDGMAVVFSWMLQVDLLV